MEDKQELAEIKAEMHILRDISLDIDEGFGAYEEIVLTKFKILSDLISENTARMNNAFKRIEMLEAKNNKGKEKAESSGAKKPEAPTIIVDDRDKKENKQEKINPEAKTEEIKKVSSIRQIKLEVPKRTGSFKNTEPYIPIHTLEKEYKRVTEEVYNFPNSEELFYSSTGSIHPRITAIMRANPDKVRELAAYGFLDLIYLSTNLAEIQGFDDTFVSKVSQFAKGRQCILKFYTIAPELEKHIWHEAFHLISINYLYTSIHPDVFNKKYKPVNFCPNWMINRRALGIKAIQSISENLFEKKFQTICATGNWILVNRGSPSDPQSGLLGNFHDKLINHDFYCSPEVRKEACRLIGCHNM